MLAQQCINTIITPQIVEGIYQKLVRRIQCSDMGDSY